MKRRVYIETHGCQMNARDSERMLGLLGAGYETVASPDEADVLLLNTCTIREKPEQKVYSAVGRWALLKQVRPDVIIAVTGCVAQQQGPMLRKRAPAIDLVLGTHQIHRLPVLLDALEQGGRPMVATDRLDLDPVRFLSPFPGGAGGRVTAFLTIMEGCDKVCSFCIVPYVRGRELSRPVEEILAEAHAGARRGVREVTLLGQNVNAYGRRMAGGSRSESFAGLLRTLSNVPGLLRIRYTSPHPSDFGEEVIRAHADLPTLCRHLHLPVQSGSDRLLGPMRRRYTRSTYLDLVRRLRASIPDLALTTDLIVGFPGEGEEEFQETLALLEEVRYDQVFAFKYSPRPHTAASRLEGRCPAGVLEDRLERVLALQRSITERDRARLIGRRVQVLIEGPAATQQGMAEARSELTSRGGLPRIPAIVLAGRTSQNQMVHVAGGPQNVGRIQSVQIERVSSNALYGCLHAAEEDEVQGGADAA